MNLKPDIQKIQINQCCFNSFLKHSCIGSSNSRQLVRQIFKFFLCLIQLHSKAGQIVLIIIQLLQFFQTLYLVSKNLSNAAAVFGLQTLDQIQPVLCLMINRFIKSETGFIICQFPVKVVQKAVDICQHADQTANDLIVFLNGRQFSQCSSHQVSRWGSAFITGHAVGRRHTLHHLPSMAHLAKSLIQLLFFTILQIRIFYFFNLILQKRNLTETFSLIGNRPIHLFQYHIFPVTVF